MRLAVNGLSALRLLRILRSQGTAIMALPRCNVVVPDPAPGARWTKRRVDKSALAQIDPAWATVGLNVAVPTAAARIQSTFAKNTVYQRGLPEGAFLDLGEGLCCAGPELVFLEMSRLMLRSVRCMLGHELCGTFTRNADDPRLGDVSMGIAPATSVGRIRDFLAGCDNVLGLTQARDVLDCVADNAWSPMEALIASLMSLGISDYGYMLGPLVLNPRNDLAGPLLAKGSRGSRVPDIQIAGTPVGINYDGRGHLDFSEVDQAFAAGDERALRAVERDMREKVLDDLRRDRELAACGLVILPITSEDVITPGGLDAVMALAVSAVERFSDKDVSWTHRMLEGEGLRRKRQRLIWSLYPWEKADAYAREMAAKESRIYQQAKTDAASIRW